MQIKKRKLKVFVGYQINSEYHDTKELKETIFKVKKTLKKNSLILNWTLNLESLEPARYYLMKYSTP